MNIVNQILFSIMTQNLYKLPMFKTILLCITFFLSSMIITLQLILSSNVFLLALIYSKTDGIFQFFMKKFMMKCPKKVPHYHSDSVEWGI